jgi:hypothetical protein
VGRSLDSGKIVSPPNSIPNTSEGAAPEALAERYNYVGVEALDRAIVNLLNGGGAGTRIAVKDAQHDLGVHTNVASRASAVSSGMVMFADVDEITVNGGRILGGRTRESTDPDSPILKCMWVCYQNRIEGRVTKDYKMKSVRKEKIAIFKLRCLEGLVRPMYAHDRTMFRPENLGYTNCSHLMWSIVWHGMDAREQQRGIPRTEQFAVTIARVFPDLDWSFLSSRWNRAWASQNEMQENAQAVAEEAGDEMGSGDHDVSPEERRKVLREAALARMGHD